jgi:hypothetical protein
MRGLPARLPALAMPALTMIALAIGFIVEARSFKPAASLMPTLVGWSVLALAALDLATRRLPAAAPAHGPEAAPSREGAAIVGLLALVAGFFLIGLLPAASLFTMLALRLGAGLRWRGAFAAGLLLGAMLWLVFGALLGLDLPAGFLIDGDMP